jgi:Tfp pilus assembly protein PilZ
MDEKRRHFRLREYIDVAWKIEGQDVSGDGAIVNISLSGILLQTDKVFRPSDNCVLSIDSGLETLPFASKKGKIIWFRRIYTPEERFQCGVQFLPDATDNSLQQWIEKKVNQLSETTDVRILGNMAF